MDTQTKHECDSITTAQHALKVTISPAKVAWLIYSEKRSLHIEETNGNRYFTDKVEIEVRAIGSFSDTTQADSLVMEMRGTSNSIYNSVSFSDGYIMVADPWRGLHIGTYMMNRLVSWAIEHYPTHHPADIKLMSCQAQLDNKTRRNRFYEQFGFRFTWDDGSHAVGSLESGLNISDLHTVRTWEQHIEEMSIIDAMSQVFSESRNIKIDARLQAQSDQHALMQAIRKAKAVKPTKWIWGVVGLAVGSIATKLF